MGENCYLSGLPEAPWRDANCLPRDPEGMWKSCLLGGNGKLMSVMVNVYKRGRKGKGEKRRGMSGEGGDGVREAREGERSSPSLSLLSVSVCAPHTSYPSLLSGSSIKLM